MYDLTACSNASRKELHWDWYQKEFSIQRRSAASSMHESLCDWGECNIVARTCATLREFSASARRAASTARRAASAAALSRASSAWMRFQVASSVIQRGRIEQERLTARSSSASSAARSPR